MAVQRVQKYEEHKMRLIDHLKRMPYVFDLPRTSSTWTLVFLAGRERLFSRQSNQEWDVRNRRWNSRHAKLLRLFFQGRWRGSVGILARIERPRFRCRCPRA